MSALRRDINQPPTVVKSYPKQPWIHLRMLARVSRLSPSKCFNHRGHEGSQRMAFWLQKVNHKGFGDHLMLKRKLLF
jgi:hypothetical protein